MKDISQYPITFPFGATTPPYSPSKPHLGVDRKTPEIGVSVLVNGQLIGLTGNSGKSSGPHHHLQRVQNGMVVNPGNGGFDIPKPSVVFAVGETPIIGKYIRIRDAQGVEWSHFHLSDIRVKVGDRVGEDMIQDIDLHYARWSKLASQITGKGYSRDDFRKLAVGKSWLDSWAAISDSTDASNRQKELDAARHAAKINGEIAQARFDQQKRIADLIGVSNPDDTNSIIDAIKLIQSNNTDANYIDAEKWRRLRKDLGL